MTIKDFYKRLGNISLNISFYFIFVTFFVFFFIVQKQSLSGIVIFIILSLLYYFLHIYYLRKSIHISNIHDEDSSFAQHYLVEQDHRSLYFFRPNGVVSKTIKVKRRFAFYQFEIESSDGKTKKIILKEGKNNEYTIFNPNKTKIGQVWLKKRGQCGGAFYEGAAIHFTKNYNRDIIFYKNKQELARLRKGWMPLSWVRLFRLNTPVVSFFERISEKEKDVIYLIIRCIL